MKEEKKFSFLTKEEKDKIQREERKKKRTRWLKLKEKFFANELSQNHET